MLEIHVQEGLALKRSFSNDHLRSAFIEMASPRIPLRECKVQSVLNGCEVTPVNLIDVRCECLMLFFQISDREYILLDAFAFLGMDSGRQ